MLAILAPLLLAPLASAHSTRQLCTSQSQPNPIASTYPDQVTGTINGTLAVLPIPLAQAQQIVGAQYPILTAAYRALLPDFPADMYPAILQAVQDHDVQANGVGIPDFTVRSPLSPLTFRSRANPHPKRISIEYPFLDLLHAGTGAGTSFRLALNQTMTATAAVALAGSAAYGTRVSPALFDPACDAYAAADDDSSSTTHLNAWSNASLLANPPAFTTRFTSSSTADHQAYPLSFWANVTNQPAFADPAKGCDRMVRLFNSSVTTAAGNAPVPVRGEVWAADAFFPGGGRRWVGVEGVRVDTAFIEYNYLECASLAGYGG